MQVETVRRFGLGEDGIVVAPTGSGKSATWELAALMNPDKVYVIVVALDAIREEQVRNYTGTSIKALGLDPEVLSGRQTYRTETQIDTEDPRQTTEQQRLRRKAQLLKDIQDGAFNLIFASPEILFSSGPIVQILSRPSFRDRLGGIFVDEAHVVDEWGVRENARTHQPFAPSSASYGSFAHWLGSRFLC
ncbi:hypothetical protein CF336_g7867 [Tilletia laevis]|nr:hypothetical protein CF336_g7867 [Tilletia laevis]KAE8186675.1 hypothetical protein CF335_g7374 [Tilletia laevis]